MSITETLLLKEKIDMPDLINKLKIIARNAKFL